MEPFMDSVLGFACRERTRVCCLGFHRYRWIYGLHEPHKIRQYVGLVIRVSDRRLVKDRAGFWAVVNHDTHHWFPTSNYGQYIVFWDRVFGTYKEGHPGV